MSDAAGDNLVLALIALLPLAAAAGLWVFFGRLGLHRRPARRWLWVAAGNLLVLVLLASLVILAGEVRFRFFHDATDSFALTKTSLRWFERHYHLNNAGVRDSIDYDPAPPPGARRVTFVGDSFAAGHGVANVEDRFANRVRALRPGWQVHAMASRGLDTGEEVRRIENLTRSGYKLDVVVLVYCLNDIADLDPRWQAILKRVYEQDKPTWLVRHSFLINTMYYRWKAATDPDIGGYFGFVRQAYAGPVWPSQRQRLQSLRDRVRAGGGRLLVVTFPFLQSLGPEYEFADAHRQLDALWRELDVPHLDLLDVYRDRVPAELTVNAYDAHPNERAHAMAADAIVQFLDANMARPLEADAPEAPGAAR